MFKVLTKYKLGSLPLSAPPPFKSLWRRFFLHYPRSLETTHLFVPPLDRYGLCAPGRCLVCSGSQTGVDCPTFGQRLGWGQPWKRTVRGGQEEGAEPAGRWAASPAAEASSSVEVELPMVHGDEAPREAVATPSGRRAPWCCPPPGCPGHGPQSLIDPGSTPTLHFLRRLGL